VLLSKALRGAADEGALSPRLLLYPAHASISIMAEFQSFRDSLPPNPDGLEEKGYVRFDEATTDSSRWVWFKKRRKTWGGEHELEVAIRYELSMGDAPGATYSGNCNYTFNDVEVSFWRIEPSTDDADEVATVKSLDIYAPIEPPLECCPDPNELLHFEIHPKNLQELESLVKTLCP
jgi:hypothetical protein